VLIGPDAEVKGDVTAPSLAVGAGAVLEGQYAIGPKQEEAPAPAQGA
jgi:cytoskeletal protein CcmA (bactofilin family)